MNIATYFQSLDETAQQAFAQRAGASLGYLTAHLLGSSVRKRPKNVMIVKLVNASEGNVSLDEAIDYFLVQPVKKLAAELDSSQAQTRAAGQAGEVKGFDTNHKPSQLRRVVGRDFEQMNIGGMA